MVLSVTPCCATSAYLGLPEAHRRALSSGSPLGPPRLHSGAGVGGG